MSFLTGVVIFVVGLISGTVVRWFAGLAAIGAIILVLLGITSLQISLVDHILQQYYVGNELLFLAGFLFGIDASTKIGRK